MSGIVLENIVKKYGNETVIEGLNLTINEGEFLVIVGPSGCGKSTTLRMIAGLEYVSGGKILINDIDCTHVEPKSRNIAMVFQNYALYPHMNVADNMSFSLKLSKTPKAEVKQRVDEAAKILDLEDYLERKPKALSGGQRQRVAMGRAIVRKPYVFLFDEPLSNLDAKLRGQMRTELSLLHTRLNKTTVYVTHDQIEAMTLADRIVIMNKGEIQQIGSPEDVYYHPANRFVAGFIGSPPMNFFETKIEAAGNGHFVSWGEFKLPLPAKYNDAVKGHVNTQVTLGIRPEHINYARPGSEYAGYSKCKFKVEVTEFSGTDTYLVANHEDELFKIVCDSTDRLEAGSTYDFAIDMNEVRLFDAKTGKALY